METQPYPPPFRSYVAPAMRRPQLWRLLIGLMLCIVVYTIWVTGVLWSAWTLTGSGDIRSWSRPILKGETPFGALVLLYSFFGMALGAMLAVRWLHRRSAGSLFGRAPVVIRDFVLAASLVAVVYVLGTFIWAWGFDAVPNADRSLWLRLLPVALVGILVQTGAEELLFRGYLQQQLAARFRNPLLWLVLPAVIFGAVHFDPATAGDNVWLLMMAAGVFGLIAADLTLVTGSIGAAWGFHFANNLMALLFLSMPGTLSGLSLFTTPYGADEPAVVPLLVILDLAVLALAWALVRRAVRR